MPPKMGFWPVLAVVMGAQIGTSILMSPTSLAPFGLFGLLGWGISSLGAVFLALVFSKLAMKIQKTGGPHTYVEAAFGKTLGFFTAWTYWVMSFVSTTVVVTACVGYLTPFLPDHCWVLPLEILILLSITAINIRGVKTAGFLEFILSNIKIIPLVILPFVGLFFFDVKHFAPVNSTSILPVLSSVITLTLFGFVGLEAGTTAAGSVLNPQKIIPRATFFGTLIVGCIYLLNSVGIMGAVPFEILLNSKAPYADAAQILFGGKFWGMAVSFLASIMCLGTLNAWMLTSGQIALGASLDQLFPKILGRVNSHGAPVVGLCISCIGILPFLILTSKASFAERIYTIVDLSVTAVVFVYSLCVASFFVLQEKTFGSIVIGVGAILFCCLVVYVTPFTSLLWSLAFVLSGVPVWLWMKNTVKRSFSPAL